MNTKIASLILSLVIGITGISLVWYFSNVFVAIGLFLSIWGNNITLRSQK